MAAAVSQRNAAYRPAVPAAGSSNAPQGTFLPGTKVQVGDHRVVIEKYLSEGGFAHVYVVRIPRENNKYELAVLKRVAVPDKEHLASMRTEVETMKKLKGHKHIVTYYDSHASQLKGGGYEVFLLMEYCQGSGLIDFMNTRLQHRLEEAEILKIFEDIAQGVACMHYLKPPLLHRDLKVENVLIAKGGKDGTPVYKVCDFGSTAQPRPAATTAEEGRLIEEDVQKHTTMQYRSPEMIDVWRKRPIDEKSDIWALGVLLYKLCYYTTPFEEVGQMAILNASFKYPAYPQFSDRLKKLIGWMLKEDPLNRPNIYQVVREVCSMRGTEPPIKDIYTGRTQSEKRRTEVLPNRADNVASPSAIGLQKTTTKVEAQALPDITPMRRGRPGASQQASSTTKPQPSPARGDPFAALDSKNYEVRVGAVDELSKRFPSLDEFSIAHDKSGGFQFSTQQTVTKPQNVPAKTDLQERVTNALADEAFSSVKPKPAPKPSSAQSQPIAIRQSIDVPRTTASNNASPNKYTSTGTGSSPPPNKPPRPAVMTSPEIKVSPVSKIWRVPSHHKRSTSQPRASPDSQAVAASLQPNLRPTNRPALLEMHRSKSQTSTVAAYNDRTPSPRGDDENLTLARAKTTQVQSRPTSAYVSSNLDFLRDQESSRRTSTEIKRGVERSSRQHSPRLVATDDGEFAVIEDSNIENDMDFLHSREGDQTEAKHRHHRKSSNGMSFGHRSRNSLPSISGATKEIFKGRFGDAFKRFEPSKEEPSRTPSEQPRTPEATNGDQQGRMLSPIAGSDATPSKHSDDDYTALDEPQELPPDVRREMERRRLSQEERRVAEAARQYRERLAADIPGQAPQQNRGVAIQQRVQTLLDEGRSSSPVKRTAEGYGRYTDANDSDGSDAPPPRSSSLSKGPAIQKPIVPLPEQQAVPMSYPRTRPTQSASTTPTSPPVASFEAQRTASRPSAPPKPKVLRTAQWPPAGESIRDKPLPPQPSGNLAALLAKDLEGVPDYPARETRAVTSPASNLSPEDVEKEFNRRYPSLNGIEMVETDIGGSRADVGRVREI